MARKAISKVLFVQWVFSERLLTGPLAATGFSESQLRVSLVCGKTKGCWASNTVSSLLNLSKALPTSLFLRRIIGRM